LWLEWCPLIELKADGLGLLRQGRKPVRRLMRLAGLVAIYQRANTSTPAVGHKI
jgi:hypothetical protein